MEEILAEAENTLKNVHRDYASAYKTYLKSKTRMKQVFADTFKNPDLALEKFEQFASAKGVAMTVVQFLPNHGAHDTPDWKALVSSLSLHGQDSETWKVKQALDAVKQAYVVTEQARQAVLQLNKVVTNTRDQVLVLLSEEDGEKRRQEFAKMPLMGE